MEARRKDGLLVSTTILAVALSASAGQNRRTEARPRASPSVADADRSRTVAVDLPEILFIDKGAPAGHFIQVLMTREPKPLEPSQIQHTYYITDIGVVQDGAPGLVDYSYIRGNGIMINEGVGRIPLPPPSPSLHNA